MPCKGGVPPLEGAELGRAAGRARRGVDGRRRSSPGEDLSVQELPEALDFTNRVGELAEAQGHHPDIALSWKGAAHDLDRTRSTGSPRATSFSLPRRIGRWVRDEPRRCRSMDRGYVRAWTSNDPGDIGALFTVTRSIEPSRTRTRGSAVTRSSGLARVQGRTGYAGRSAPSLSRSRRRGIRPWIGRTTPTASLAATTTCGFDPPRGRRSRERVHRVVHEAALALGDGLVQQERFGNTLELDGPERAGR